MANVFDAQTLARLTFVREALRRGLAFQGDTAAVETAQVPRLDPTALSWSERARIYGVDGLPQRWWSGEFRHGRPVPTEDYIRRVERMYMGTAT